MILAYITLSYILSLAGFFGYKYLCRSSSPTQKKIYIHAVVICSLALPYPLLQITASPLNLSFLQGSNNEEIASADHAAISECYKMALNEVDFCNCQDLEMGNIVLLSEDPILNRYLDNKSMLWIISVTIILALLVVLLLRIGYLVFLIKTSERNQIRIGKQTYTILRHPTRHYAASFRLIKKYILWKPSLDLMDENAKKAVLYHEVAHLRNWDTWQQIFLSLLKVIWIVNPFFYFIKRELSLISEYMADAFAVKNTGDPAMYASLLIQLKENQQYGIHQQFGADDLRLRIMNILEPQENDKRFFLPVLFSSILLMISIGVFAAPPVKNQVYTVKNYEMVHAKKEATGKNYFCKSCLIDELEIYCSPE